jgi:hypothetical protein
MPLTATGCAMHLEEVVAGLKPFHEATLQVEGRAGKGHHGAAWEVCLL